MGLRLPHTLRCKPQKGDPMDPMIELARGFLRSEREAGSTNTRGADAAELYCPKVFPKDIYDDIDKQIASLTPDQHQSGSCTEFQSFLWRTRDERAQDVLADVFYAAPRIARRVCEIRSKLIPEFIRYLVDEARRQWEIEKGGMETAHEKQGLEKLFTKHRCGIHDTCPNAFELLESPKFMHNLACYLGLALPFSLVLRKELDEISSSRNVRLRPDPDATLARMMDDVLRSRLRLTRVEEAGNQDIIKNEKKRLNNLKCKAESWIGSRGKPHSDRDTGAKEPATNEAEVFRLPSMQAEDMSLFGLALSGGGIRSATFNLGILQGLADLDLLRRVDYLSGVSGGSHIAGWLSAWIKREPEGIRRVQRWLSTLRSPTPDTAENHPIQFLRRFSSYLAPRKGLFSADRWSIVTIWARNAILNQILFILLLSSLLIVPKLMFALYRHETWFTVRPWIGLSIMLATAVLSVLIGISLRYTQARVERRRTRFLSTRFEIKRPPLLSTQFGIKMTIVTGALIVGSVGSAVLFYNPMLFVKMGVARSTMYLWIVPYLVIMADLWIIHFTSHSWRLFLSQGPREQPSLAPKLKAVATVLLFSALSAFAGVSLLLAILYFTITYYHAGITTYNADLAKAIMVVFGPALVFGILSLVVLLQIGLMGRNLPDSRREWWDRLAATLLIPVVVWIALSSCALGGPALALSLKTPLKGFLPALWLTITAVGARWGFISGTPPLATNKDPADALSLRWFLRTVPREWIARIAPYVYIAGLGILLSLFLYAIPVWIKGDFLTNVARNLPKDVLHVLTNPTYWDHMVGPIWLLPAMLALAAFLALRFDVNEFSMHSFYRNRLVRCFLGASRADIRNPNPFTGFDSDDDMRLSLLRGDPRAPKAPYSGPFLIFNTALNLVAGKELAWQERKAASFVLTPLYCGYELPHSAAYEHPNYVNFGYRSTKDYAEPNLLGPSLGTAMAISGAAINPNMGYHSSPAVSFLMALCNARLGYWIGNTRHRTKWRQASPKWGLTYMVNELIGGTNDTSRFVNLSDGGHFENLGLYELVRRHCMYIVVSDAEEDLPFSFGGLGNAIRKCRADFGIDIRLDPDQLRPVPNAGRDQERSRTHCAVGDIVYSAQTIGKLLYIKTSLTGDEPGDVLGYKLHHSDFPHQTTFHQFFGESQFESYRALGQHIAMVILQRASEYAEEGNSAEVGQPKISFSQSNHEFLNRMFESLKAIWRQPAASMVALRERHRDLYDQLAAMFNSGNQKDLCAAAKIFFRTSEEPKGPFLAYSKMIELMHRVFQDLDLEIMADHPHNEGWMNIFRGWAQDVQFQNAWKNISINYDNRFTTFCKKELDLQPAPPGERLTRISHKAAKAGAAGATGLDFRLSRRAGKAERRFAEFRKAEKGENETTNIALRYVSNGILP